MAPDAHPDGGTSIPRRPRDESDADRPVHRRTNRRSHPRPYVSTAPIPNPSARSHLSTSHHPLTRASSSHPFHTKRRCPGCSSPSRWCSSHSARCASARPTRSKRSEDGTTTNPPVETDSSPPPTRKPGNSAKTAPGRNAS